jgi:hypothetical protein
VSRRCCWQPAGGKHLKPLPLLLLLQLLGQSMGPLATLLGLLASLHCCNQVLL